MNIDTADEIKDTVNEFKMFLSLGFIAFSQQYSSSEEAGKELRQCNCEMLIMLMLVEVKVCGRLRRWVI